MSKRGEQTHSTSATIGVVGVSGVVGLISSVVLLTWSTAKINRISMDMLAGGIGSILFVISLVLIAAGVMDKEEKIKLEKKQKKYLEQVQGLGGGDKDLPDKDALELIKLNLSNINEYYIWSQKQAKSAFNAAIATCSVGFLLVVAAVLIPIVKQDFNSTISFISFLGGAITEVIGGTIFFVYRKSLTQLNYYHKALHEDQRFLSSVNLINKFHDKNAGDEMLKEIIQSAIDINRAEFGHSEEKKADKNKSDT